MIDHLGIEVIEAGDDYLKARDAGRSPHQAAGRACSMAGASVCARGDACVLGRRVLCVDRSKPSLRRGSRSNAKPHPVRSRGGMVHGPPPEPIHLGRTTHVWEIRITDERDKLVCIARITMAVLSTAMQ